MGQSDDIKIRALPRTTDPKKKPENKDKKSPRWIIYVGSTSCVVLACAVFAYAFNMSQGRKTAPIIHRTNMSSTTTQENALVNRHMQDAEIKHELMVHTREMENLQFKDAANEPNENEIMTLPDQQNYGVQMDSEDSAEKVYEDLHDDPIKYSDTLPIDRINARLAKRKWLNEQERAEKVEFIRNFIRTAYNQGYEVEINSDLVVTAVKPIQNRQLNINQVIDRLAKQGL